MGRNTKTTVFLVVVLLFNMGMAMAQPIIPKPNNNQYIFDYARIIETKDRQDMANIAKSIDDKTGAQIVVVTVDNIDDMSLEEYALKLFRTWGIGDKEKNNGILLLINKEKLVSKSSGRVRIEVGYGLEGAINDGKAGYILDKYAMPAFEEGDFSTGITDTFMAISAEVVKEYNIDIENNQLAPLEGYMSPEKNLPIGIIMGIIVFLIFFIITVIIAIKNDNFRGPFGGGGPFSGPGSGGRYPRRNIWIGGGFGSGGRSFGGGSSGGGGASR